MTKKKKPYHPNNWHQYKDAPEEWFKPILYDQFTDWKLAGWELPSSVACVIRVTNIKTKKITEHTYVKEGCARNKIKRLIAEGGVEITLVDHENIHYLLPEDSLNGQHDYEDLV